jgi:hypothetical protein
VSYLFAMTLPALVVLLVIAGVVEVTIHRRRRRRDGVRRRPVVASTAVDTLGLTFAPSTRHKLEHDEYLELNREQPGDAAPPRSRVDLDSGTARLVLPRDRADGDA